MQRLHQLLQQPGQLAITAATGMGGIGKTDLAWHYAEQHRADYPAGIWWIGAAQVVVKVLEYSLGMGFLPPPEEFDAAAKVQWCYQKWLEAIPDGNRLLVWDDVIDADRYTELRSYLPTDQRFRLLITTRAKLGSPVRRLELGVLKPSAALRLLRQLVEQDDRIKAELPVAKALTAWLGYLPLGIELIGRHLALHPNLELEKLQDRLEAQKLNARALQQVAPEMPYRDSLAAAFELSWQSLSETAQRVAELLSLFALTPIPQDLIADCLPEWDEEDLEDCLDRALVGSCLATVLETGNYLLHGLTREFFAAKRSTSPIAADLERNFAQAMEAMAQTVPQTVTLGEIARLKHLIPHIEAAAPYSDLLDEEDCLGPYVAPARFYAGQSLWQPAEYWFVGCKTMTEARFGSDHPSIAASLNNLALLYESQGRYTEAEPLLLQALDITRSQLGQDHIDTAQTLNNLALLYDSQGRYTEVEPLLLQALDIIRSQLGQEHLYTATSLNNLAALYKSQGRYSEAEILYLKALDIRRIQLGQEHPDTATSLNNLALLYESQGRYSEAEPLLLQALDIRQIQLGQDHPSVATSLNSLALLYSLQGHYSEAEPLYLQALNIIQSQLGQDHPSVATSLNSLALLYSSQGRYSEAEPLYLQALDVLMQKLGVDHPNIQTAWRNFVYCLQQAITTGQSDRLSDHPMTQALLKQLTAEDQQT